MPEQSKVHVLKCWIQEYGMVTMGQKLFEYRKNDRNYRVGDLVVLREWDKNIEEYTGEHCAFIPRCIIYGGQFGIPEGYCIMSIHELIK